MDQCIKNEILAETEDCVMFACSYPQMGGYGSVAVVTANKNKIGSCGCFDVWVWHDGEFPFAGEGDGSQQPKELHHCDPDQFIKFGNIIKKMRGE